MSDFLHGLKNEVNVGAGIAVEAPSALINQIQDDFANNKTKLITSNLEALGVGAIATAAFKSAPLATMAVSAVGLAAYGGYKFLSDGVPLLQTAWTADSASQQNQLAQTYGQALGKSGAGFVETMPGFIGGGAISAKLMGNPAVSDFAFNNITRPVEFPLQELRAFNGKGSSAMLAEDVRPGAVNAWRFSESVEPFTKVEQARALDLQSGKVSRLFDGDAKNVTLPFDKENKLTVHSQPDVRPSRADAMATPVGHVGVTVSGDYRTFFIGQKGVAAGEERLQGLYTDQNTKTAFLLDNPRTSTPGFLWEHAKPQYVDYAKALDTLKTLDVKNAWQQFQGLPRVAEPPVIDAHVRIAAGKSLLPPNS